jgi:ankyrin repeat protein
VLSQSGADKEARCAHGATPFIHAAEHGRVAVMRLLLQLGVDKEAKCAEGRSLLHCAANHGRVEVIKFLVQQLGVDKDARTARGATPLHFAAKDGQVEAIKVLVQLGADKDAKNGQLRIDATALGGAERARCWCSSARTWARRMLMGGCRCTKRQPAGSWRRSTC